MMVLWVGLGAALVYRQDWHALVVLTLTVAAAIVQLRWLASQVSSLVSMTLRSAEEASPEPATALKLPREPGATQDLGASSEPRGPLGGPENAGHASGEPSLVAVSPGGEVFSQPGESEELDHADFDSDGSHPQVPGVSRVAVLRPVILLGGLLFVFAVGSSEPIALAAGVLTLPAALMIEALVTMIKNPH